MSDNLNTSRASIIGQYIVTKFEEDTSLGFEAVYYGDQDLIPHTPTMCVDTGITGRELAGAPFRTINHIQIFLLIYHSPMSNSQKSRLECDQFTEAVVAKMHEDLNLNGLVIHGYCTSLEPGYATRGGALLRASRITWEGLTKTGAIE